MIKRINDTKKGNDPVGAFPFSNAFEEKKKRIFKKGLTKAVECAIINNANSNVSKSSPVDSFAGVAELADARDLKSRDTKVSYRFDPGHRHHRGSKAPVVQNIAE